MQFFYFDGDEPPRSSFFLGYAFAGREFVFSSEIANKEVGSGFDGAYTSCVVREGFARFGVDWNGAGRLFYYKPDTPGKFWAVSNSLILLAEKLHEKGVALTLDDQQLSLWGYIGAFVQQMSSSETIYKEIKLAPRWMDVVVTGRADGRGGEIAIEPRAARLNTDLDYKSALSDYISEAMNRILSLAKSGSVLSFDLSGGLDSRTTFSFASALVRRNPDLASCIRVFSSRSAIHSVDYEIAEKIVRQRGISLSPDRGVDSKVLPSPTPFRDWELNRGGQYTLATSIYRSRLDPGHVKISGAGGESYRPFWEKWSPDIPGLLRNRKTFLEAPVLNKSRAAEKIQEEINALREFYPPSTPDLSIHYRDFRARFHTGVPATEKHMFHLLAGRKMEELASAAPQDYFDSRQVYFDIIANLDPDLLSVEFDSPQKAPTAENMARLTRVDWSETLEAIETVVVNGTRVEQGTPEVGDPNVRLIEEVARDQAHIPEGMVVREGYLEKRLEVFRSAKKLDTQAEMHPFHYIYLRNKVLSLASRPGGPVAVKRKMRGIFRFLPTLFSRLSR